MKAEIHIYGPTSMLKGKYPVRAVKLATSYPVDGAKFSDAFRKGRWDGRKHLFKTRTGAFPTGLVSCVRGVCEEHGVEVSIVDHRKVPKIPKKASFELEGIKFDYPYEYQPLVAQAMVDQKQGIVKLATNAGKTEVSCAVTRYLDVPTLFVVTNRELLYQARKRFQARLGLGDTEVGIIGDGNWSPGSKVTIATVDTLESRLDTKVCIDFLESIELMFLDEAHHVGSETWYTVSTLCPAYYRFGLSGTPLDRTDGANLRLIAATGEIVYEITNKELVDRGISAPAKIIFDKVTTPILKKKIRYQTAYKEGVVENPDLTKKVVEWTKVFMAQGLSTLILVEEVNHGKIIDDALWNMAGDVFIPHQFIHGTESTEVRQNALDDFANRNLPVLIASTILDEGVDVPTIDCLICAGSRKSRIRTMQRLGRGLRGSKLIVVEFANYTNDYLLRHSLERLEDYKAEDCFTIKQSEPDAELVKKLWEED